MSTDVINLKWSVLPFLQGCGEDIYLKDRDGVRHLYVNEDKNGIHYCEVGEKRKMRIFKEGQKFMYTPQIYYRVATKMESYKYEALAGHQYVSKMEAIRNILDVHSKIDKRPANRKLPCGNIQVPVMWSDSQNPTFQIIHYFYDKDYMEKNANDILKSLEEENIKAKLVK